MKYEGLKINKESVDKLFPKQDINVLGYESPVKVIMGQMRMEQENDIYRAVIEQGVNVNKEELIKALRYDRDQYDKGYKDGYDDGYDKHSSEVAREIFEEIDKMIYRLLNDQHYIVGDMCYEAEELKKKYTEEGK